MPSLCHLAVCLLLAGPLHQPGERWLPLHPRRALTLLAPSLGLRPPPLHPPHRRGFSLVPSPGPAPQGHSSCVGLQG